MNKRKLKILGFLRKAEDEIVEMMEEDTEIQDAEKKEIASRLKALESKVGVMEHRRR